MRGTALLHNEHEELLLVEQVDSKTYAMWKIAGGFKCSFVQNKTEHFEVYYYTSHDIDFDYGY